MKVKTKIIYLIMMIFIGFLVTLELFLSNQLTTEGKKIEAINQEISKIEQENNLLRTQIASLGGLQKLAQKAQEKGFIKTNTVLNLTNRATVAVRPNQ